MHIKLDIPVGADDQEILRLIKKHPDIEKIQAEIGTIQNRFSAQIGKVLKDLLNVTLDPDALRSFRTPRNVLKKREEKGRHSVVVTDKLSLPYEITPEERNVLQFILQLGDIFSQISKHKQIVKEKRTRAQSARHRLSRIATHLEQKGLKGVQIKDLETDSFLAKIEAQKPEQDPERQEEWETILLKIWQQHEKDIPQYQESLNEAEHLPADTALERIGLEPAAENILRSKMNSLRERPEFYSETIQELEYLLKNLIERITGRLEKLGVAIQEQPMELEQLFKLLQQEIICSIKKTPSQRIEVTVEPVISEQGSKPEAGKWRHIIVAGLALFGTATALTIGKMQEQNRVLPERPASAEPDAEKPAVAFKSTPVPETSTQAPGRMAPVTNQDNFVFRPQTNDHRERLITRELNILKQGAYQINRIGIIREATGAFRFLTRNQMAGELLQQYEQNRPPFVNSSELQVFEFINPHGRIRQSHVNPSALGGIPQPGEMHGGLPDRFESTSYFEIQRRGKIYVFVQKDESSPVQIPGITKTYYLLEIQDNGISKLIAEVEEQGNPIGTHSRDLRYQLLGQIIAQMR